MKFDFIIGNPPYQEETESESTRMPPVYHRFMDAAYKVCDSVCLITPARFLYNAGWTPTDWNEKMLNDPHFKVILHEQDSAKIFPNTDIKGGVAIHIRNAKKNYGALNIYTMFPELNSIIHKVWNIAKNSIENIVSPALSYGLTNKVQEDYPELINRLRTNAFSSLSAIFFDEKPDDNHTYIQMLGIEGNKRCYKWVRKDYISNRSNSLNFYKVLLPKSNGSGAIGEILSTPLIGTPLIGTPLIGHTQSFISIGHFETLLEAENCLKYIKSKFARTMLGVLKITQDNPPEKWKYVPLQDFTPASDIDWSVTVVEIDRQLYAKYGLSEEEMEFIESKVRAM